MNDKKSYEHVLKYIGAGIDNAISANTLSSMSGLSLRETEREIQKARIDGVIVCSNTQGYFYPENTMELSNFYKHYHSAAITTLTVLKHTRLELIKNGLNPQEIVGGR